MEPLWSSQSFDMLGALLGVLLLIFIVAWVLKRIQQGQGSGRAHLKVLSVLPLSTREKVVLIQAGEEQVLVGVSGAGIQQLHTLKEPVEIVSSAVNGEVPATPSFADALRQVMTRRTP
ncbi:MAG: flagellar biosynthetic protein FliO [Pseudomonadota bacterium]